MPMVELAIPQGALAQGREELMRSLTASVLRWERAPESPQSLELSWGYVVEFPAGALYHRGRPDRDGRPRYRLTVTVPQGMLNDAAKSGLVREATELVLAADGSSVDDPSAGIRVWVIIEEVSDGNWGGAGRIWRLADIANYVGAS
jgi:phenylpyruvate tautomerase PptA (4-oxalocrotonate tautomerase family)